MALGTLRIGHVLVSILAVRTQVDLDTLIVPLTNGESFALLLEFGRFYVSFLLQFYEVKLSVSHKVGHLIEQLILTDFAFGGPAHELFFLFVTAHVVVDYFCLHWTCLR